MELGPDALIMADPGLILMVRERWPEMPIHLSVQANTMNYCQRPFLAGNRELNGSSCRANCRWTRSRKSACSVPEMELEVFVHGALCIAYSGRCLLSGYFNHRDANQGSCTNSCRWDYKVKDATVDISGDIHVETDNPAPNRQAGLPAGRKQPSRGTNADRGR